MPTHKSSSTNIIRLWSWCQDNTIDNTTIVTEVDNRIQEGKTPQLKKWDQVLITSWIYAGKQAEVYDQYIEGKVCVIVDEYLSLQLEYGQIKKNQK